MFRAKISEGSLWTSAKQGSFKNEKKYFFLVYNCRILVTGPIMPLPKVFPAGSVIELCGAAVLRTSEDCN